MDEPCFIHSFEYLNERVAQGVIPFPEQAAFCCLPVSVCQIGDVVLNEYGFDLCAAMAVCG